MKFDNSVTTTLLLRFGSLLSLSSSSTNAFSFHQQQRSSSISNSRIQSQSQFSSRKHPHLTQLSVSIGLGPEKQDDGGITPTEKVVLVPGVDYEIPDHEAFRTSRRTVIDETCDAWFHSLLGTNKDDDDTTTTTPFLGEIAMAARSKLLTPVELKNEFLLPEDHVDFTAYANEKLPWEPLVPAFGLEEFGLPIPRRNADTWRQFDVPGMVSQDYSGRSEDGVGSDFVLADDNEVTSYKAKLAEKGGWLEDDAVTARLVFVNGRFCPQLSITTESVYNMAQSDLEDDEVENYLSRFTDGFTDELVVGVPSGPSDFLTSFSKLSFPDHCVGDPTSQFAINSQQGTACFAALNSVRTSAVAMIRSPAGMNKDAESDVKPVLLVNAISRDMGCTAEKDRGVALFVKEGADVSHSYLEETGGMVTGATELRDDQLPDDGSVPPRVQEASRPALKDTHLEAMDVHVIGNDAKYSNTVMSIGGSGRVRIAMSVSLLRPGCFASVKGFSLSGGAQRTDMKTNIHHIAQATSSQQLQKSMVGGRATGAFRGRIRVEQSAQQTASNQLSRTILLSDRCRAWTAPTLEIIADDVQCTHGATVSDLSEEELFYLRSRGLDQATARNMLMYAFAGDISASVDPSMRGEIDSQSGVTHRVIQRLENLVPRGDRKVKSQFQSV
ncbi:Uncharacterized protein family (UPF0051) [Fragilaria crotonensis]|nr:Uncharacterized protein family (UPF0051) [Fragilaria crotonensis]